jgi:NADH-quinone oxidoreductase subunit J
MSRAVYTFGFLFFPAGGMVFSFFGSALLFYLMGAPLLATLEVIIYAGAIMVLFLFIIMMVNLEVIEERVAPLGQRLPAVLFALFYLALGAVVVFTAPGHAIPLEMAMATPVELGKYLFQRHWLSIEIVSLLLLVAIVGVLHLGKRKEMGKAEDPL